MTTAETCFFRLGTRSPTVPQNGHYYVAPGAKIIGDVHLGHDVSIWFNAVLRGDNEPIEVGSGSNVQDGCIVHTDPGYPVRIGENVTIGHNATVHGCSIGAGSLIGIGATVLNGAVVGRFCLVAAGALIRENMVIPDRSLVVGIPARIVGNLTAEQTERMAQGNARYRGKIQTYTGSLIPLTQASIRKP
ncbi:MAG: gamma carbonic anhydrase family protein [Rhizobium sp.]|uniref:gamma carbonic anhydrase family protein n=1 Tax=Rhizobium sp. TaxID=391 RepID=UPI0030F0D541